MKNLILLLCAIFISNSHSADIYYKLDPKVYKKSLNADKKSGTPVEVIPKAYDGLTPISLSISFGYNIDYRIPNLVNGSGVFEFMHQNDIVITYDKKYEINNIIFGHYCYHPDTRYGTLYYWNYDSNDWVVLFSRSRSDYATRNYNFPTIVTDKFLALCSWGSERGYTSEFRISFQ